MSSCFYRKIIDGQGIILSDGDIVLRQQFFNILIDVLRIMIEFGTDNIEAGNMAPFLLSFEEGQDNAIRLIVALASKGEKEADINDMGIPELGKLLKNSYPLYPSKEKIYELIFEQYLIHQTRNESLCCWDDYEISHGNFFIVFERSRLLDYMDTLIEKGLADAYWPDGWKHYGICCQNHIIDIISPHAPTIKPFGE